MLPSHVSKPIRELLQIFAEVTGLSLQLVNADHCDGGGFSQANPCFAGEVPLLVGGRRVAMLRYGLPPAPRPDYASGHTNAPPDALAVHPLTLPLDRSHATNLVRLRLKKGRVSLFGGPRECGGLAVQGMPSNDSETRA
jgi:hypothetical protein